jgi:hypothetical protein
VIIDAHTHIFPRFIRTDRECYFDGEPAFKLLYHSQQARLIGTGELIAAMDENGVERSVVFGFPWKKPETIHRHNDYIIEAVIRYPNRLIGLCCFDPEYQDGLSETRRCLQAGLSGVGELASYLKAIDKAMLDQLTPVMQLCEAEKRPVLLHANEPVGHNYPGKAPDSLAGIYRFIRRFQHNTVVLAHWGGGLFFYSLLKKEVKESLENVYFDTAASPFLYDVRIYQKAKELIGAEKILFGSDFPLIRPVRYFDELEQSGLTKQEIALIKGENTAGLFHLNKS